MHILLISPKVETDFYNSTDLGHHYGLQIIAAITPPEHDIQLVDENIGQKIRYNEPYDLVGVTVFTAQAQRAYHIAAAFRERGVRVILGGHHVTVLPDEAIQHCDSVCIGEVETIWSDILADAAAGNLKPRYQSNEFIELDKIPWPRRDLMPLGRFGAYNYFQTNRGCPFDCSFCSLVQFYRRTFRVRPVADLVAEIRHLQESGKLKNNLVYFLDDNIIGDPRHAKALFEALIPLRIKWISQCSLNIAKDDHLLSLAQQSGCMALLIGFESVSRESLTVARKRTGYLDSYAELIAKIHAAKIQIIGSFMFGFDSDGPDIFDQVVRFVIENHIEHITPNILTPWPGTDMYDQYESEGRLLHKEWRYYDMYHVVYQPKQMTPQELQAGFYRACQRFYTPRAIFKRVLGGARTGLWVTLGINLAFMVFDWFYPRKLPTLPPP